MVQDADVVRLALRLAVAGADFPDAVISRVNAGAGCDTTVTFDVGASRHTGMRLL